MVGEKGVEYALAGESGIMVTLDRISNDPYICVAGKADLADIANKVKSVPVDWITPDRNYVTKDFLNYVRPLIMGEAPINMQDGLPLYVKIDRYKGKV